MQSGPELSVRFAAAALRDDAPVETLTRTRLQELARVSASGASVVALGASFAGRLAFIIRLRLRIGPD